MKGFNHYIFWPVLVSLCIITVLSVSYPLEFIEVTAGINTWLLVNFGWLYSGGALLFLGICITVYFSPLGKIKIGGADAKPLLSKSRWFSITLCTTIATGILFWGTAEPLFHFHGPPSHSGISPSTDDAQTFALSTMFLHWSFIPYGIYTLMALMFALSYYNKKLPFSIGSTLFTLIDPNSIRKSKTAIDAICIFSLIAGMSASLGAGVIIIAGGLDKFLGLHYSIHTLGLVTALIVITFIISSVSGLQRGIRTLSYFNVIIFILLAAFVFFFGPSIKILEACAEAFLDFISNFFSRSLSGIISEDKTWSNDWTVFYWANWLAWTPVTALFLGQIGKGYSVRSFIHINLLFPSLFSIVWMSIFSGATLHFDQTLEGFPLFQVLKKEGGVSQVIFELLNEFPWRGFTSLTFLLAAFLSYVTAADSNTSALSSLTMKDGFEPTSKPTLFVKIVWGILIGTIAWVMVAFSGEGANSGIDGIRILSNLGGFPALILVLMVAVGTVRLLIKHKDLKL